MQPPHFIGRLKQCVFSPLATYWRLIALRIAWLLPQHDRGCKSCLLNGDSSMLVLYVISSPCPPMLNPILVAIKLLKPRSPVESPRDTDPSQAHEHRHSPSFDLNLARVSLFIEVIAYTLIGLASTPFAFALFTLMGSLGGGFSPAVHSVALELYSRRGEKETGKLFGALSVLQALGSVYCPDCYDVFQFIKCFPQLADHWSDRL